MEAKPFIFCADNDHARRVNKGIVSATKAAELTGGSVIFPAFTDAEKAQGLTDFNDWMPAGDGPLFCMSSTPS